MHLLPQSAILHSVTDSAILSKAEQRKQQTAFRLSAVCRRLTAERGLSGFTIEEVCDEVGVSRRTFFNYYPSKEEAVLGFNEDEEMDAISAKFLALGSRGWGVVIDDLVDLVGEYVQSVGPNVDDHLEVIRVIDREPKLLARFIGAGREREEQIIVLVASREGVDVDDPYARAIVDILSTAMRSSVERLLADGGVENFGSALSDSLTAIRAVLAPSTPRKAQQ